MGKRKKVKPEEYPSRKGLYDTIGMCHTDPLGSYTGQPTDGQEVPVQDADDL